MVRVVVPKRGSLLISETAIPSSADIHTSRVELIALLLPSAPRRHGVRGAGFRSQKRRPSSGCRSSLRVI